jgi:dTDP-4-dehydrorhamnose 3,5-epimerase
MARFERLDTRIEGVGLIQPKVFGDERGFFLESYNKRVFRDATGLDVEFVQDNHSRSKHNVLRGLHYQVRQPQGKLVRVIVGEVFDVAVDLRRSSPTFAKAVAFRLDADSKRMAWIPPGFAHGYLVTSAYAEFFYKTTDYYAPGTERTLLWNDPALLIRWPLEDVPILAEKDRQGLPLNSAETFP